VDHLSTSFSEISTLPNVIRKTATVARIKPSSTNGSGSQKNILITYVQSTAHQTKHFGLFNALISIVLALISNDKCIA
jgi:hypothetical protein